MPAKKTDLGTFDPIDEFEGGFGWIAHQEETMRRASHALVDDGDVWIVDPVDAKGLDKELAAFADVAGVVVLFNYHGRDANAVAARHNAPVYLPAEMTAMDEDAFSAPVERFENRLGETDYHLREVATSRVWQEWSLYDGKTLVVAESVGTADYFVAPGERLGVSMVRRLTPPRSTLGGLQPDRILCGHGEGIFAGAASELRRALRESRRTAPGMYVREAPTLVRNLTSALLR